jgi:hypothetical protein
MKHPTLDGLRVQLRAGVDRTFVIDPSLYAQIGKALSDSIGHRESEGLRILTVTRISQLIRS